MRGAAGQVGDLPSRPPVPRRLTAVVRLVSLLPGQNGKVLSLFYAKIEGLLDTQG